LKDCCCKESAQSREFKYAEVFEGFPQGVRAGVSLKTCVCKESSEGLGPLNHSRENMKLKSLCGSHIPEKDCRVNFEPKVLVEETERSKFSEENS
jgi:hypothetical protein